jgi:hypothetical protein
MVTTVPKAVKVRRPVATATPPHVTSRAFSTASRAASTAISIAVVARVGDTITMADHQTTWVRLKELALDGELAAEISAKEAFDAEEKPCTPPNWTPPSRSRAS